MKPRASYCSCVGGTVPLDHWSTLKCPDPPMPIGWLLSLTKRRAEDKAHSGGAITANRSTWCLRHKEWHGESYCTACLGWVDFSEVGVWESITKIEPKPDPDP